MRRIIFVISLVCVGLIVGSNLRAEDQPWQLRLNKEGISVSTRKVESSPILEFKSNVTVPVSTEKATAFFEDEKKLPHWYYQCIQMDLLKDEDPLQKVFYFAIRLPWPVAKRDLVFRRIKTVDAATGSVSYELTALPGDYPKQKGRIRIHYLKTVWRFTPLKDGTTEIYFQQHSNAGGSIPPFIANALVLDIPFQSLRNFKDQVNS